MREFINLKNTNEKFSPKSGFSKKRKIIILAIVLAVAASIIIVFAIINRREQKNATVYEALVNIVDQKAPDPTEDARGSLKKGDVISYFPEGHSWSDTEKNSYLIVKIKLTPEDAVKLTQAETREAKNKETRKGPDGKEIKDIGPKTEIILARKYRLDIPDFDIQKFWNSHEQPFADKIFNSGLIDKK